MRKILFRGKSANDGEWVEGSLVITTIEPADEAPIKHYHIEDMTIGVFPNEHQSGLTETVDPNTVGQYTGLTDIGGKNIFEGDIMKTAVTGLVQHTGVVEFADGAFGLRCTDGAALFLCFVAGSFTIIGNIHDNPDLLKWED